MAAADVLLFETQQDLLIIKVMLVAAEASVRTISGKRLPIMVQASRSTRITATRCSPAATSTAFVAAIGQRSRIRSTCSV